MDSDFMLDDLFMEIGNVVVVIYCCIVNFKIPKFDLSNKKQVNLNRTNIPQSKKIDENHLIGGLREYFMKYFISKKFILFFVLG